MIFVFKNEFKCIQLLLIFKTIVNFGQFIIMDKLQITVTDLLAKLGEFYNKGGAIGSNLL
jgi:hypothetical protein